MESENHKLLSIIGFIGIVISFATISILPTLSWSDNETSKVYVEAVVEEKIKYEIPKRVSLNK